MLLANFVLVVVNTLTVLLVLFAMLENSKIKTALQVLAVKHALLATFFLILPRMTHFMTVSQTVLNVEEKDMNVRLKNTRIYKTAKQN